MGDHRGRQIRHDHLVAKRLLARSRKPGIAPASPGDPRLGADEAGDKEEANSFSSEAAFFGMMAFSLESAFSEAMASKMMARKGVRRCQRKSASKEE